MFCAPMQRIYRIILTSLVFSLGIANVCFAQINVNNWPAKPIKLIVPLAAGGASDVVARIFAAKLGERLGQQVIVENRPGAEGLIGVEAAVKSAPDGYTLVLGSSTTLAANFHLRKSLPFHPVNDLEPVSMAFQGFSTFLSSIQTFLR